MQRRLSSKRLEKVPFFSIVQFLNRLHCFEWEFAVLQTKQIRSLNIWIISKETFILYSTFPCSLGMCWIPLVEGMGVIFANSNLQSRDKLLLLQSRENSFFDWEFEKLSCINTEQFIIGISHQDSAASAEGLYKLKFEIQNEKETFRSSGIWRSAEAPILSGSGHVFLHRTQSRAFLFSLLLSLFNRAAHSAAPIYANVLWGSCALLLFCSLARLLSCSFCFLAS